MRGGCRRWGARCGSASCLVPGLTDGFDNVEKVADFCAGLKIARARGDPALPPDGQRQVAQARPRISAGERRAARRRVDGARPRPVPQPRVDRLLRLTDEREGTWNSIKTLLEQQPLMALFLTIAHRLSRRRDQHQGLLARRGRGLVRRARHGLVRAEVGAGADGRDAGPRALPLCAWASSTASSSSLGLTSAAGLQGQPHGADRRAAGGRGEHPVREDAGPHARARARACSRDRAPARRRCRRPSRRSATTTPRSATRSPIRSAWPGRSCSCTSPS